MRNSNPRPCNENAKSLATRRKELKKKNVVFCQVPKKYNIDAYKKKFTDDLHHFFEFWTVVIVFKQKLLLKTAAWKTARTFHLF